MASDVIFTKIITSLKFNNIFVYENLCEYNLTTFIYFFT